MKPEPSPTGLRPLTIKRNATRYAEGSVLISMGHTKVLCNATVEQSVPNFLRNSDQGWVTAEYAMLPRSTTTRNDRESRKGKVTGRSMEISRLIGRSLRAAVDLTRLAGNTITLDCDVIQADGGTRCAAITGSMIALVDGMRWMVKKKLISELPLKFLVAAISVGIVKGKPTLDLCYEEDCGADVDMNVVMTEDGRFVEIQGTAEQTPFTDRQLLQLKKLAAKGIRELISAQRRSLRLQ